MLIFIGMHLFNMSNMSLRVRMKFRNHNGCFDDIDVNTFPWDYLTIILMNASYSDGHVSLRQISNSPEANRKVRATRGYLKLSITRLLLDIISLTENSPHYTYHGDNKSGSGVLLLIYFIGVD